MNEVGVDVWGNLGGGGASGSGRVTEGTVQAAFCLGRETRWFLSTASSESGRHRVGAATRRSLHAFRAHQQRGAGGGWGGGDVTRCSTSKHQRCIRQ